MFNWINSAADNNQKTCILIEFLKASKRWKSKPNYWDKEIRHWESRGISKVKAAFILRVCAHLTKLEASYWQPFPALRGQQHLAGIWTLLCTSVHVFLWAEEPKQCARFCLGVLDLVPPYSSEWVNAWEIFCLKSSCQLIADAWSTTTGEAGPGGEGFPALAAFAPTCFMIRTPPENKSVAWEGREPCRSAGGLGKRDGIE